MVYCVVMQLFQGTFLCQSQLFQGTFLCKSQLFQGTFGCSLWHLAKFCCAIWPIFSPTQQQQQQIEQPQKPQRSAGPISSFSSFSMLKKKHASPPAPSRFQAKQERFSHNFAPFANFRNKRRNSAANFKYLVY